MEQRSAWFRGLWEVAPVRQKGHTAMFPIEIPRRLMLMYSFAGETVLDPFLGSGTTTLAAHSSPLLTQCKAERAAPSRPDLWGRR